MEKQTFGELSSAYLQANKNSLHVDKTVAKLCFSIIQKETLFFSINAYVLTVNLWTDGPWIPYTPG